MCIEGTKTDLEGVRLGQVQSHGAPVKGSGLGTRLEVTESFHNPKGLGPKYPDNMQSLSAIFRIEVHTS